MPSLNLITKITKAISTVIIAISISQVLANTPNSAPKPNQFWWPDQLDLSPLRQHDARSNPAGDDFNYAEAFNQLDLNQLKSDIEVLMTDSQDWWPADWGHYGPFFIRMAWHSAGTYRVVDGRGGAAGGQQRFEPLNSWPDNANLDKARRLLWPIKQKYGRSISWADLMVLTGNVALESMGFKTFGFAGGREDDWEADLVYWGPEKEFLADERHGEGRKLAKPLGAVQMGLIYVNPEGPGGNHDPISAAADIRQAFGRMAMNDEETVALIAGGHTFGKTHGAKPTDCVGPEPAAADIEEQGLGWTNKCGSGKGADTTTSGLEGAWTANPTKWTTQFFAHLFGFEWVKSKSPAGATQWIPADGVASDLVKDAHIENKSNAPIMLTTDLSLKMDPEYNKISKRFLEDPKQFELAFAKAWYKLTHRDMGPRSRYLGSDVPNDTLIWQDPIPVADYKTITAHDADKIKQAILKSKLSVSDLVRTAWAAASSYRNTDMRGGANGARLQLAPQNQWAVNDPAQLNNVLDRLQKVQQKVNKKFKSSKQVSLADIIVLGGAAAIEKAVKDTGYSVDVAFTPGRTDASQAQTDIKSFALLEPTADAFRNYYADNNYRSPTEMLIDKANTLGLNIPEMSVLVAGMRVLDANSGQSKHGVLTDKPGTLSNDFFINLLDMNTKWSKSTDTDGVYEGKNYSDNKLKWTATAVDLIFGSNSELRAVAEFYAAEDSKQQFIQDFVAAWSKVMMLDRFDVK